MIDEIMEILELSIKKNGVMPLTNQHLLNILRMAEKRAVQKDYQNDMMGVASDWKQNMNYDDLLWKCQGILEPKDYMRLAGLIVAERELIHTNKQLKEKNDELYHDKERWYRMSEMFCNKMEEMKKNES